MNPSPHEKGETNEIQQTEPKKPKTISRLTKEKSLVTKQVLENKYMNQKLTKQALERKKL